MKGDLTKQPRWVRTEIGLLQKALRAKDGRITRLHSAMEDESTQKRAALARVAELERLQEEDRQVRTRVEAGKQGAGLLPK